MVNGTLLFRGKVVIPASEALKGTILETYYNDPLAGHFGRKRTEELIRRKFYWKHLSADVAN